MGAGDREAGAALPLQQTSRVQYRAAVKHSAETQLQGLRLMAANRGCFTGNELDGLDLRIEHLDDLVRKYSQPI